MPGLCFSDKQNLLRYPIITFTWPSCSGTLWTFWWMSILQLLRNPHPKCWLSPLQVIFLGYCFFCLIFHFPFPASRFQLTSTTVTWGEALKSRYLTMYFLSSSSSFLFLHLHLYFHFYLFQKFPCPQGRTTITTGMKDVGICKIGLTPKPLHAMHCSLS